MGWTWVKGLDLGGNERKRRENTRIWAKAPGLGLRHLDLAQNPIARKEEKLTKDDVLPCEEGGARVGNESPKPARREYPA